MSFILSGIPFLFLPPAYFYFPFIQLHLNIFASSLSAFFQHPAIIFVHHCWKQVTWLCFFSLKFSFSPRRDGDKDAIQDSVVTCPCSKVPQHYWSPLIHEWGWPQLKCSLHHNAAVFLYCCFFFFFSLPSREAATQNKAKLEASSSFCSPAVLLYKVDATDHQ